jgi:hypothetical protein
MPLTTRDAGCEHRQRLALVLQAERQSGTTDASQGSEFVLRFWNGVAEGVWDRITGFGAGVRG